MTRLASRRVALPAAALVVVAGLAAAAFAARVHSAPGRQEGEDHLPGCPAYHAPTAIGGVQPNTMSFVRAAYAFDRASYRYALFALDPSCLARSRSGPALEEARRRVACLRAHHMGIDWWTNASAPEGSIHRREARDAVIDEVVEREVSTLDPATEMAANERRDRIRLRTVLRLDGDMWQVRSVSEESPTYGPCT